MSGQCHKLISILIVVSNNLCVCSCGTGSHFGINRFNGIPYACASAPRCCAAFFMRKSDSLVNTINFKLKSLGSIINLGLDSLFGDELSDSTSTFAIGDSFNIQRSVFYVIVLYGNFTEI